MAILCQGARMILKPRLISRDRERRPHFLGPPPGTARRVRVNLTCPEHVSIREIKAKLHLNVPCVCSISLLSNLILLSRFGAESTHYTRSLLNRFFKFAEVFGGMQLGTKETNRRARLVWYSEKQVAVVVSVCKEAVASEQA